MPEMHWKSPAWPKKIIKLTIAMSLISIAVAPHAVASFEDWKEKYIRRAAKKGIPKKFSRQQLKTVTLDLKAIERSQRQVILDRERDYPSFIKNWIGEDQKRIRQGRELIRKHQALLSQIEKKYRVDKEVIVSLWGTETLYGEIVGDHDLIQALASLAYKSHRKRFFEIQLNASMRLLKKGHVTREHLVGSWAGATGQCQFMPSNFNAYARDYNGDGRKDIWATHADIFASIAYFLKKVGWKKGQSIGTLAVGPDESQIVFGKYYSKEKYKKLGWTQVDGSPLGGKWKSRRAAEIPFQNSPIVLRGTNYIPLMRWNKSSLFAAFNIILTEEFKKTTR